MRLADPRIALGLALGVLAAGCAHADGPANARTTPTRPGSPPPVTAPAPTPATKTAPAKAQPPPRVSSRHIPGEWVSVVEMAATLGLKGTWIEPDKRFLLANGDRRIELEVKSREVSVDRLRVFLGEPVVVRGGRLCVSRPDFESYLKPLLKPELVGSPLPRPRVIALDPGHGGADNGMQNTKLGLKEKVLALDVALRLKKLLEAGGYKVVLTRTDDRVFSTEKKIDLPMRAQVANRAHADLFVSIHFNSLYPDTKTSGTEVYVFTRAGQRSDRAIGAREGDDTETGAAPVNRFDPWSALLAHSLHRDVIAGLKTFDRGQKTMHAAVLRGLDCPGALVESVFLSNDAEAKRAATPEFRQQIAAALAAGIDDYAKQLDSLRPKP